MLLPILKYYLRHLSQIPAWSYGIFIRFDARANARNVVFAI